MNDYIKAKGFIDNHDYPSALEIINEKLDDNPNDAQALFLLGTIFVNQERRGLAYNTFARCVKHAPDRPEAWVMFGRCHGDSEEEIRAAEFCQKKAIQLADGKIPAAWANLATLEIQKCNPKKALEYADKALEIDPEYQVAKQVKGFAYLHLQDWPKAWKYYDEMLGTKNRTQLTYNDTPRWDGKDGQTLLVYGEQGIGDELMYASCIADLAKNNTVILDSMPRLKNLLQRSFPDVEVVGDRFSATSEIKTQSPITGLVALGELPKYYRNNDEDFPGTPYLQPDPDMREAMRGLLQGLGDNPKIGIAWQGGSRRTRGHFRTKTLEELLPILRHKDMTFVSLMYQDCQDEIDAFEEKHGIKIHHFPWITAKGLDYDLTAALVSELDLVISVPTCAVQCAGALGIECHVLVPKLTGWLYDNGKYPWAKSVTLHRGPKAIKQVEKCLPHKEERKYG